MPLSVCAIDMTHQPYK